MLILFVIFALLNLTRISQKYAKWIKPKPKLKQQQKIQSFVNAKLVAVTKIEFGNAEANANARNRPITKQSITRKTANRV